MTFSEAETLVSPRVRGYEKATHTVVTSLVVFVLGFYVDGEFRKEGTSVFCDGAWVPHLLGHIKYFGNNSSGPTRPFAVEIHSLLSEMPIAW